MKQRGPYQMKRYITLLFFGLMLLGCSKNPLSGGDSLVDPDIPSVPTPPVPGAFTQTFDFNNSTDYVAAAGAEITGGFGQLVISDTLDNSTGASGADFSNAIGATANLTVSANKVEMISGTTGTYVSRVMDGMTTEQSWNRLNFISSLPFGKQLSATAETGYGNSVIDFSDHLTGLWHLNESSGIFADSSGAGHHANGTGITYAQPGIFGKSVKLSGTTTYIATGAPVESTLTISMWASASSMLPAPMLWRTGPNMVGPDLFFSGGKISLNMWDSSANPFCDVPVNATDGNFHHYVTVIDGGTTTAKLYYDGVLCGSAIYRNPAGGTLTLSSNSAYDWHGNFAEAAMWNRALSVGEVSQLYRRGANRLKMQIRACADKTCSANPDWIGYDGTNSTFFSELNNNSNPVSSVGFALATPFQVLWRAISSLSPSFDFWLTANARNRFVQYKSIFESDTTDSFPDLTMVSLDPQSRYSSSNPSITSTGAVSVTFSVLSGIAITEGFCTSILHYALGNDANSFLGWNGSAWVTDTDYSTAGSKTVLESLSAAQWALFPKGAGNLYIKVYLPSSGLSSCSVDSIDVSGNR